MTTRTRSATLTRSATVIVAVVLFAGPAIAFAVGIRGAPAENRVPAPVPRLADGWHFFHETALFIGDRIPLRTNAIEVDGWIDRHVFGENPAFGGSATPRVYLGGGGQYFLYDDVSVGCANSDAAIEAAANLSGLITLINHSGRRAFYSSAPNKSTILGDLVPDDMPSRDCLATSSNTLSTALRGRYYIDLVAALTEERESSGHDPYYRQDSHWDEIGALHASRSFIEAAFPGVWDDSRVSSVAEFEYRGDLSVIMGDSQVDTALHVQIAAPRGYTPGLEVRDGGNLDAIDRTYTRTPALGDGTAPAPLVSARTLVITDSFGVKTIPFLEPWFEDLTVYHLDNGRPDELASRIQDADVVWVLSVERSLVTRFRNSTTDARFVLGTPTFRESLARELAE